MSDPGYPAYELDLLHWSKRARGPLRQAQGALPNTMTASPVPPVPERVHRSPLDYVAAPNSHNANFSVRSPYILDSTPQIAKVQPPYILGSTPPRAKVHQEPLYYEAAPTFHNANSNSRSPYILDSSPQTARMQQSSFDYVAAPNSHNDNSSYRSPHIHDSSSQTARMQQSSFDYVAALNSHNGNSSYRSPHIHGSSPQTARVQQSPLDYVAASNSQNVNFSHRSPYILGSTPQTVKGQQTPNNNVSRSYNSGQGHSLGVANTAGNANAPSYSLYGRQCSPQVPNLFPTVQRPGVRPDSSMSHKTVINHRGGQQHLDEGSSYQRPYVLDNENVIHSETPPRVMSSQEDQSRATKEELQPQTRPPTYYEHTGGTLTNAPPWKTGVTANMDFKTKTFIDAHGATFNTDKCGPYRYVKPTNRMQELAIIPATYQTIVDFVLYLGDTPRQKIRTWDNSYNEQYQQIQRELVARWYVKFRLILPRPKSQRHTDFIFYLGRAHQS